VEGWDGMGSKTMKLEILTKQLPNRNRLMVSASTCAKKAWEKISRSEKISRFGMDLKVWYGNNDVNHIIFNHYEYV